MARFSGRKGRVYTDITSGGTGTATPLPFVAKWTFTAATNNLDATAMEDSNKTYVADLPDASGTVSGFMDDASRQTYDAALDGVARKFYLYSNASDLTKPYWYGTVLWDFNADGGVGQTGNFNAKWNAASTITRINQRMYETRVGDSWRSTDDLTLAELEAIETATGTPWSLLNPLRSIPVAKALLSAWLIRDGKSDAEIQPVVEKLTARHIKGMFRYIPDEDTLPVAWENGFPVVDEGPKADAEPSTSGSSGEPSTAA